MVHLIIVHISSSIIVEISNRDIRVVVSGSVGMIVEIELKWVWIVVMWIWLLIMDIMGRILLWMMGIVGIVMMRKDRDRDRDRYMIVRFYSVGRTWLIEDSLERTSYWSIIGINHLVLGRLWIRLN